MNKNTLKQAGIVTLMLTALLFVISWGSNAYADTNISAETGSAIVEAGLRDAIQAEGSGTYLVILKEQADLSAAYEIDDWEARGWYVYDTLREVANRSQADLVTILRNNADVVKYQPHFILNAIHVTSGVTTLDALATHPGVDVIEAERFFTIPEPEVTNSVLAPEWGVEIIRATEVWADFDIFGAGVVLATIDTGVQYNHPALEDKYRGTATGSHDFNFFDPANVCSGGVCDNNGHGTHVTGSMLGDDGGANQIGVAPEAQWIAAKGCESNSCSEASLLASAEWMLAPCEFGDAPGASSCDPNMRPHVINNSWGGGGGNPWYQASVDAWRAADMIPVFSAGNSGPGSATIGSPSDYCNVMSIGGTNSSDGMYPSSSRGPGAFPGCTDKPDMSAPGQGVRSSIPTNSYATFSGTSMASPHVSGCIALMLTAAPMLDYDEVYDILITTAADLGAPGFDYDYGHGRIDCYEAVNAALIAAGPFRLEVTPTSQDVCVPANTTFAIDVLQNEAGFIDPVTLAVFGVPAGYTPSFSVNPVTPPGDSLLTLTGGAAAFGSYDLDITGTSITGTFTSTVGLNLFTASPGGVTLTDPADGATNVDLVPTFAWSSATQAATYYLELATDVGFTNVIYTATTDLDSYTATAVLDPLSTYYWRVTASNACGDGATSAASSFTTRDVPPILVVDDDNNSPDVRSYYTDILDDLGLFYDVWDTGGSDNEPSAAELAPYDMVIWFTGSLFGGSAGPGAAGEAALASWLDNGNCLFISSQDYLWDRGLTSFMQSHLGVATFTNDVGQTTVTGDGSLFGGLGPYPLTYPFSNWSDRINPDATAEVAFIGNQQNAAVNKDDGVYRTTFWGFPFEAMSAAAREETMQVMVDWCGAGGDTGTLAGTVTDGDSGDPLAGAVVDAGFRTATTNNDGEYSMTLPVGTYDLTASATNYQAVTVMGIDIITDTTTMQDFTLFGSHLTYSPAEITESMEIGDVVTTTVTVTNTGPLPIDWSVAIGNYAGPNATVRLVPQSVAPLTTEPTVTALDASIVAELASEDLSKAPTAEEPVVGPLADFNWPMSELYDNGPLVTHPGGGAGGADASALQTAIGLDVFGFGVQQSASNRIADDFEVTGGGWTVDTITLFAYQTGSSTTSTITGVNLRIWDGPPGDPGSSIVFGDTTTNRMLSTGWTNIYRVLDTAITNTQRPVMYAVADIEGIFLPAGTYWVDWQLNGSLASGPWAPPISILGETTTGNGLQQISGVWNPLLDSGTNTPQGMPFIIEGSGSSSLWASAVPDSGTIPPNSVATFEVVFDASSLYETGTYTADLEFSGTFVNDPPPMPLTMILGCSTCGFLEGEITDDCTGDPLVANIHITGPGGFDVMLSGDSYSNIAVQPGSYTIEVSADGYFSDSAVAVVTQGDTTTTDFALVPEYGELVYSPTAIEEFMEVGDVVANTVTVTNTGTVPFDFSVAIGNYAGPAASVRLVPLTVAPLNADAPVVAPSIANGGFSAAGSPAAVASQPPLPTGGGVSLVLDDGSREDSVGLTAGGQFIWLNRFTPNPSDFPFTLNEVQVLFGQGVGVNVGELVDIYVYEDIDGDGNPGTGSNFLGSIQNVGVQATDDVTWSVYPIGSPIVLNGPGDVLIAVVNRTAGVAPSTFVASIDQTVSQNRSWVGTYAAGNPGNPPTLPADSLWGIIDTFGIPGNWMVRGYGSAGTVGAWAYADPASGTIPANSTATFEVIFDATALLQEGTYTAELSFSGDFENSPPVMPLTMHLECPTCGFLEGEITDDLTGDPVTADINIVGDGGVNLNLVGDSYDVSVPADTYTITVSADGYFPDSAVVSVNAGETVVTDFALTPIYSELAYSPESFEVTMGWGTMLTETFIITNNGTAPFDFSLSDAEIGSPGNGLLNSPAVVCPPDAFGYSCTDSTEADGLVTYDFEDISATGTAVSLGDDQVSPPLPIGFDFDYYGIEYTDIYISSNGFLTVLPGQPNGCCTGGILPSPTTPNGVIAGWWEDLNPASGGTIHYQTMGDAPNRYLIIQFTDVPHFPNTFPVTHQYKLFEGSNNIEVHYLTSPSDGGTHSAGIENHDGTIGLQYYRGTASLPDELAVCYLYPGQTTCGGGQDAEWLDQVPNSGTVDPGETFPVSLVFDASVITQTGTYTAEVYFAGTFDNMVAPMTVVMHVEPPDAGIDLTLTVGLDPDVCGTENTLNVAPGTEVYYCYTVTNTGNVMLPNHTITDTFYGHVSTFVYDLMPGETESVMFPKTVDATVTSTARWTASHAGIGMSAMAEDTATVTVGYSLHLPIIIKP